MRTARFPRTGHFPLGARPLRRPVPPSRLRRPLGRDLERRRLRLRLRPAPDHRRPRRSHRSSRRRLPRQGDRPSEFLFPVYIRID